jgi:hypothetical protein
MNLAEKIKISLAARSIENQKKNNPFDENLAEHYHLPPDAGPHINNSYYFSGHDRSGISLIFRLGQRGGGEREVWFALKDENGSIYCNSEQVFENGRDLTTSVLCIETGKKWSFSFSGKIPKAETDSNGIAAYTDKMVYINFEGTFVSSDNIFEFSRHMDSRVLAKAIAKEKWSADFFRSIKENHQVHYEQAGEINGLLTLDGKEKHIKIKAIRDHSFGKRDWNYMNRHIWLLALFDNGDVMNVSMVSYPAVSELQSGYLITENRPDPAKEHFTNSSSYYSRKKTVSCLLSATSMYEIKNHGIVPENFELTAGFMNNKNIDFSCKKELEFIFPFNDVNYTIHEGIGVFNCNGISGRGIMEFGFNRDSSRWVSNHADI